MRLLGLWIDGTRRLYSLGNREGPLERLLLRLLNVAVGRAMDRWKANFKEVKDMSFKGNKVMVR